MTAASHALPAGAPAPGEVARPRRVATLLRNRLGLIGAAMLLVTVVVAVAAPILAPYDPYARITVTVFDIYQPPSAIHPLGTDDGGGDVFSKLLYGTRVSLVVGFAAAMISLLIGGAIGLVAGYVGGRVGGLLMRFTDFFLVIPDLALMIVIVAVLRDRSLVNLILVIGALGWTTTARLVRSQVLSLRERKFVARARAVGAGDTYIVRRHILPLALPLMLANTVLVISLAILSESTLAFIGLGDPTVISWGQMLNFAFERGAVSAGAWWALVPPGLAIVWVVLGTTLLGTAMEEVFNPRLRRHYLERGPSGPPTGVLDLPDDPATTRSTAATVEAAGPGGDAPLLAVRDLSIEFEGPRGPMRAVDRVSFDLRRGEILGLVGESGSGKTTTVLGLMRLLPPGGRVVEGSVRYGDRDILQLGDAELRALRWSELAIVFQGAMNALNPVRTVRDQIAEAIRTHERGIGDAEVRDRADELLRRVGIGPERGGDHPHTLSGGMRQRAMIALALACRPEVIIADEPTTALDVMVQAQILELLVGLAREFGMGTILVTHDLGVVAQVCDRVVVMYGGRVAEDGDVATIFGAPKHPYTQLLLRAFPSVTDEDRTLRAIPGTPPRVDALPPGCRFAARCPHAFERCTAEVPIPFPQPEPGHRAACFLVERHG